MACFITDSHKTLSFENSLLGLIISRNAKQVVMVAATTVVVETMQLKDTFSRLPPSSYFFSGYAAVQKIDLRTPSLLSRKTIRKW